MDTSLNKLVEFYLNNTINLCRLFPLSLAFHAHKMAIVLWPYILWCHSFLYIGSVILHDAGDYSVSSYPLMPTSNRNRTAVVCPYRPPIDPYLTSPCYRILAAPLPVWHCRCFFSVTIFFLLLSALEVFFWLSGTLITFVYNNNNNWL